MRKKYILLYIFIYSCRPNFSNQTWEDGSLKTVVRDEYYENQHRLLIYKFKKGEKDSLNYYLKEKFMENGQILEKTHYINKQVHGKHEEWYTDGQKSLECFYKFGKKDGLYISWYPDGDTLEKFVYKEDKAFIFK